MSRFSEFSGRPKNFVNSVCRPIGKMAIVTSVSGNPALFLIVANICEVSTVAGMFSICSAEPCSEHPAPRGSLGARHPVVGARRPPPGLIVAFVLSTLPGCAR
jgi:hypothetical protein